jgi:hypothetical protein
MRDEQNAHPHPEKGVHVMLRKITFALVTAIALGGAPLTPASARGFDEEVVQLIVLDVQ